MDIQLFDSFRPFFPEGEKREVIVDALLRELGVGFNTPSIIRWPFDKLAADHDNSTLIRVNFDNVRNAIDILDRSILIKADIIDFFDKLGK